MNFSISTILFWESVGFDTTNWRKSTDGLKALVHDKYARTLVDLGNENVLTLDVDSDEFKTIIQNEFTIEVDEE
jgi:hypothetical protein